MRGRVCSGLIGQALAVSMGSLAAGGLLPAHASFIDTDFYCRAYGCVIVHDGRTFDVYDNYNFSTGGTVAPGAQMIPWTGNPFQGVGSVAPVYTGTRDEGINWVPGDDEGVLFGIDQFGNGTADLTVSGDQPGILDASGLIGAFELRPNSAVVAVAGEEERSFFLTSRTDFTLRANARIVGSVSSFNAATRLSNVGFRFGITGSGNDDGMAFGADARTNGVRLSNSVTTLSDLVGGPVTLVEFRNTIRRRSADELSSQSIRFDYAYGFEDYDMSMGAGHLRYEIEFDFYNR